jgi:ribosomal protein L11 methyltransferase
MDYLVFTITCSPPYDEILIAELANIGFESFMETATGIEAYVMEGEFDQESFQEVWQKYKAFGISYDKGYVKKVNWNEEWEKNYSPIAVEGQVYVRASFHPPKGGVKHEIVINPKMSFGTGHHATTYLMMQLLLGQEVKDKSVLDLGSGTGILAILAAKMGAAHVQALDIDEWCVENGNENFLENKVAVVMEKGSVREVKPEGPFDLILANINKNVLLNELSQYAGILNPGGKLLISGFYQQDASDLTLLAEKLGLAKEKEYQKEQWVAVQFQKSIQAIN